MKPSLTLVRSDATPAPSAEEGAAKLIEISNVSKAFHTSDGDIEALTDISLSVSAGRFVSILGPSGCGKSTLMLLAAGLEKPTSGSITLGGIKVTRPLTEIGIVFQDHALYEWRTILGNILLQAEMRRLPAGPIRERGLKLLRQTGLQDFAAKYPHELSGGMKQRAAICRALVHEPPLLFFDEPFGALDALTREQMRIDLEKLWLEQRPTVLFITHSIPEAIALSDEVVVMTARPGRVDTRIPIELPRPRDKAVVTSKAFTDYVDQITEIFQAQGVIHY